MPFIQDYLGGYFGKDGETGMKEEVDIDYDKMICKVLLDG